MRFPVVGKIKKVQDVVRHVSPDCQEVDRGAVITLQVDEIDERTLRRLQRISLNGHTVMAEVVSWQPEFGESVGEAKSEDGELRIGQEVVITKTGEVGVVNDVSDGGVLVKLGGEESDGDLVPMGLHEVEAR